MPISDQTPQVILISDETNAIGLAVSGSIPTGTPGILFAGVINDVTASFLKLDSQRNLFITGSVSTIVSNLLTASVSVTNIPTVTGSITINGLTFGPGGLAVYITGSNNTQTITGSVQIVGIPLITGSVTVSNLLTASVSITNTPTITGSVTVGNLVSITNVSLVGNGALIPTSGSIVGGSDGTYFKFLSVDSNGKLSTVFSGISGSTTPISSALVAGKDTSGNLQPLAVTTGGFLFVSTSFETANNDGIPSKIAIIGGVSGSTPLTIAVNTSGSVYVNEEEEKTFIVTANNIVIGNNKSMLSLFNSGSSNKILKIREVWIKNIQVTNLSGIVSIFEFFRFTGMSITGSSITSLPYDTNDIIGNNVTSSTGGTVTGEASNSLVRYLWSSDDWGPGSLDQEGLDHALQNIHPIWKRHDTKEKPIILRGNQGFHIKHTTDSTAGTFDLSIVFTQVA